MVMTLYGVGKLRLGAIPHLDDLVLQSAGERCDASLVGIDLEEFFPCFLVLCHRFLLYFLEVFVDDGLGFIVAHRRLTLVVDVTDAGEKVLEVDFVEARSSEVLTNAQPEGVAYFIHFYK